MRNSYTPFNAFRNCLCYEKGDKDIMKQRVIISIIGAIFILSVSMHVSAENMDSAYRTFKVNDYAKLATNSSVQIDSKTWEDFTPEFITPPKTVKAGKETELKTNKLAGVDVSYKVSDEKKASVDENGVLKGMRVGSVTVTATFTALVDGVSKTKEAECFVKIKGKKKIYIDPGHQSRANGGQEPVGPGSSATKAKVSGGCTGVVTKIPEYKFTLTMGKKLKKALIKEGYEVVMSRTKNDVNISNVERAKKGNKSGADICIRIHSDSIDDSSVRGVSVLYPSTSNPYPIKKQAKKSKKLAKVLINEYCKETGIKNRGIVVRNDLSGTNWSTIPTVLIECGFFSNPTEDKLLNDPDMQKKMVKGMVSGIDKYFGY